MDGDGVLVSIKPQWTELILKGYKKIEIRKRKPNMEPPFKVYIYCTLSGQEKWLAGIVGKRPPIKLNGKIVGEFTCDRIEKLPYVDFDKWCGRVGGEAYVSVTELWRYANEKDLYAWHISDVIVYQQPLYLEDLWHLWGEGPVKKAPQGIVYISDPHRRCVNCLYEHDYYCDKQMLNIPNIYRTSCRGFEQNPKGVYAYDSERVFKKVRN